MAGIKEYSNLMYGRRGVGDDIDNDDEDESADELEALVRDYQFADFRPQPQHTYQYVNSDRDFTLPLQKHKNIQPLYESPEEELSYRKYIAGSVGMVSLITENLLSHPFVVLRRQCQVYHSSIKYHLTPFTLFPVIIHLHQRQGITTLWKGLGSCLLVRGLSLGVEDALSKFTPWPKEVNANTSIKQFGQHLLLKCISFAIILPFYSASLVETVQSDIASEKPGVFDVFREGACRLFAWSAPQKGRMLPIWQLIGPSVSLSLSKYIFGLAVKGISTRLMQYQHRNRQLQLGARSKDYIESSVNQNIEIYSTLLSLMSTEIIFYPFETILHRLELQGTRTIIDSLDSGYSVVPILTSYEGAVDCYRTTVATEGVCGLYKGFGSIVLQFVAHVAVIKLTKWIVTQITEIYSNKPPQRVTEFYNLDSTSRNSLPSGSMGGGGGVGGVSGHDFGIDDDSPADTTISHSISSLSIE